MSLSKNLTAAGLLVIAIQLSNAGSNSETSDNAVTPSLPNGISSGDITPTSTVLWTRSGVLGGVRFQVFDEESEVTDETVTVVDIAKPVKLQVDHFQPYEEYRFKVK